MNNSTGYIPINGIYDYVGVLRFMKVQFIKLETFVERKVEKVNIDSKELILAFLILLLNTFLLVVIVKKKALIARKPNQLFINIAILHILSSASIIVSNFSEIVNVQIYAIINNGLLIEMFEMLMLLTCERVIAIKYSFKYADVRKSHIIILLLCTWILPFLYTGIGIKFGLIQEITIIVSTILIATATVILGTTNFIIYRTAKRHEKFLKENAKERIKLTTNGKPLKASYICFAIVASFMILWGPYCVHNIIWLSRLYDPVKNGDIFTQIVDFIAYLQGIADPLIFIFLSRAVKKEIGEIFMVYRVKSSTTGFDSSVQENTTKTGPLDKK